MAPEIAVARDAALPTAVAVLRRGDVTLVRVGRTRWRSWLLLAAVILVAAASRALYQFDVMFLPATLSVAFAAQSALTDSRLDFAVRGGTVVVHGLYGRIFEGDVAGCHSFSAPRGDHGIALETSRGKFALVVRGLDRDSAHEAARLIAELTRR